MPRTWSIPMLLRHPGGPRDQEARLQFAAALPGAGIGEPDENGGG